MIEVLKIMPFVIYLKGKKSECLGIAEAGYFASTAWLKSPEDYGNVSGESFGWTDNEGDMYRNAKYSMSRPSEQYVKEHIVKDECKALLDICVKRGYVKL